MDAEERPEEKKGGKTFLIALAIIIVVVAVLLLAIKQFRPQPKTLDQMLDDTLNGKFGPDNYLYNNYAFVRSNGLWVTRWQKNGNIYTIPLRFGPLELENLTIVGDLDKRFDPKNLYITFDPTAEPLGYVALGAAELSINLATALDTAPIAACIKNETVACATRPIVSCQDNDKAVIFIRESNETAVILNGNCIVIQGEGMNLLKAVDRVLYIWYGIMPRGIIPQ
ncbi:MAG: hypothetical protein V1837_07805 [Candidatus Woesearchaeota archaeon]